MPVPQHKPVIVILGGTGAVGQELAARLSAAGHPLVIGGRSRDRLRHLQQLGHETCEVEATDPATIAACIEGARERHGRIGGVVNCIGSILLKPAHATSDADFAQVVQTNLYSSFAAVRSAARAMRKTGGAVVLISTAAARIGLPNHEAIAAAKAGVEGLARSAAATYAHHGLRVNVVAPGLVQSEMSRSIWEVPASAAASLQWHALGRLGQPRDIASAIAWLLNAENDWITGQVIGVDGGLSSVVPRRQRPADS